MWLWGCCCGRGSDGDGLWGRPGLGVRDGWNVADPLVRLLSRKHLGSTREEKEEKEEEEEEEE